MARPLPRLHSVLETAELLGCGKDTVYALIAAGALESCDIAPPGSTRSKTRVSDDAIRAFIANRTRKPKSLRTA